MANRTQMSRVIDIVVVAFRHHSMCLPRQQLHPMTDDPSGSNRSGRSIRMDVGKLVSMLVCWSLHSFEYTKPPINYHPMNLLPAFALASDYNIADLLSKPLPTSTHHRYTQLVIGDDPTPLSASATPTASVAPTPTVVAVDPTSDLVPHPVFVDTGASRPVARSRSDFSLEVTQASYGLLRSPILVVSKALASKALASTPVDPYTLITGEDVSVSVDSDPVDLSSPDTTTISDLSTFTKVNFAVRQFGTASLTFIFSPNWSLIKVFVTPTQVDWIHWVPLPRLTPTESYFHIFGLDYLQAFTLLHLIPIWIYSLLHFAVNLD